MEEEDGDEVGVEGRENAENILPEGIEMQKRKKKEKKDGKEDGGEGDALFKIEGINLVTFLLFIQGV